ncbi:phosphatase PAP2 family protein [Phascolarctobacterium faecium]|uniref:phosphatase PAP2 family protein n=2 Tax=Phascolarctobacterium faecium TaxID=33025 RepID=UPI003A8772AC
MSNLRDAIVRMALRRPYLYLLVTLVISIVLMEVLVEIAEHTFIKPALQQLELQFIAYVQQFVTPPLTAEVMLVTASGSSTFYLLASALVCCWYLYSRQKDRLYLYLVCLCGGGILNQVLKRIFERVRPDIFPVIAESGYSFPSGHAMGAICFYGILAYFAGLGLRSKPLRWGLLAAAGIYILLIGLSRVYLGVHYPTDILAGYAAGATWLFFCITLHRIFRKRYYRKIE